MEQELTEKKIKKAIDNFCLLEENDHVLVGFSGGKDSVVLLHALKSLSADYHIKLTALHVNHNIRGDEAKGDEEFCRSFCQKNGIDFICKNVFAVEYAKTNKVGLEEAARILRYKAFEEASQEKCITKTATAHTASDNLETIIFNLTRGSGSDGLKGIPPVRDNFIRPLIYCTTDDVLEYAEAKGLDFVTDSTNSDTDYTRNHIRHNVIPLLKQINPAVENAISSLCDSVRADTEYLWETAEKAAADSPFELCRLHPSILTRKLIKMHKDCASGKQIENIHLREMTELLHTYVKSDCKEEKRLSLPGKIDFIITPISVKCKNQAVTQRLSPINLQLGVNELKETGDILFVTEQGGDIPQHVKNVYKNSICTAVKKSLLTDIMVRSRQDGDVFCFSNMTKKVKKMLNEAKIPLHERDGLPFLCDKQGIIWIPYFPTRDDAAPNNDKDKLYIYYLTNRRNTNDK